MANAQQHDKMGSGKGFIAALDQSGGSTPKALAEYGIAESQYSNDEQMFDLVHQMRTRIITASSFTGEKILAAILFEGTMDREIEGVGSAQYLWETKNVVPFLKIDKGLEDEADGVQLMKPIPGLDELLARGVSKGIFGTKERSVIKSANEKGVADIVDQQFALADQVLAAGLVPIIEPEVNIFAPDKAAAEELLRKHITERLADYNENRKVMLKLSLPSVDGFYSDLIAHPAVLRVVALSGGYSRDEADALLAKNPGLIASFSRALLAGLTAEQTDAEFDAVLAESIKEIYAASIT